MHGSAQSLLSNEEQHGVCSKASSHNFRQTRCHCMCWWLGQKQHAQYALDSGSKEADVHVIEPGNCTDTADGPSDSHVHVVHPFFPFRVMMFNEGKRLLTIAHTSCKPSSGRILCIQMKEPPAHKACTF